MKTLVYLACFASALAFAFAQPNQRSTGSAASLPAADETAIRAASKTYQDAGNARDWPKTLALFTDDIVFMPPNAPATSGRQDVATMLNAYPAFKNLRLEPLEISGTGGFAYVRGRFSIVMTPPNQPEQPDAGKYIEIWRKQSDGKWKYARGIFNSDNPVATPSAMPSAASGVVTGDPWLGTWELNFEKSRIAPTDAPKFDARTFVATADGEKATYITVEANGTPSRTECAYKLDGKDNPVTGSEPPETLAFTRASARSLAFTGKENGKVVRSGTREVSRDGQVMTVTVKHATAGGTRADDVWVFDRHSAGMSHDRGVAAVKAAVATHWHAINTGVTGTIDNQHTSAMTVIIADWETRLLLNSPASLAMRKRWEGSKPKWTIRDLEVQPLGNSAVATFYLGGSQAWADGSVDSRTRLVTEVWVKQNDVWKETHHHDSVFAAMPTAKPAR